MTAADETPVPGHYASVDTAADPGGLIAFLDAQERGLSGLARVKSAVLDQLGLDQARLVLDVGCGLGHDVQAMARRLPAGGKATGVDLSQIMIDEARHRAREAGVAASFEVGDAANLPFPDNGFDACRAERVLLHVPDRLRAITEMARVTRAGGRIAALEPDMGTAFVDHPDMDTTRVILDSFPGTLPHGWTGRQLPRLFRAAGLTAVEVRPTLLTAFTPDLLRSMLGATVSKLCADGVLDAGQAGGWWSALAEQSERGDFLAGAAMFLVTATRP